MIPRRMGRPRTEGRKDLPEGLHPPSGGVGSWRMKHPVTGKLKRLKGAKTRDDAVEMYWAVKEHFSQKVSDRAAQFAGGPLTSELIEQYRINELPTATNKKGDPLDDNTRRTYDNYLENFRNAAEFKVPLSLFAHAEEGPRQIRAYLATWLKKPTTYNNRLSCLNRLFIHWIDQGLIVRNPCFEITHRTKKKREVYMADDDFVKITGRMADMYHEVYARACDWLYLMSGRPTNMLDVKESEILENEIRYNATKNTQPVIVELQWNDEKTGKVVRDAELDELIAWFRSYKRAQGIVSPYLIVHPSKRPARRMRLTARRPVTSAQLYRYFKGAAEQFGLGHYQLRDIRPKALTDEAVLAGEATNKGAHKTQQMRDHYVKITLPMRVRNNLKRLKAI